MTNQETWQRIMNYEEFDRMPLFHWGEWDETKIRWIKEGFPDNVNVYDYLDVAPYFINISGINNKFFPVFEKEIIEDSKEYQVFRDTDGVTRRIKKGHSSIPQDVEYTFKTAREWLEYKKRLQPHPDRIKITEEWELTYKKYKSPVRLVLCSLSGWLRNWMGLENMIYLTFENPDVFEDYVQTMADLSCWIIDEVMKNHEITIDSAQCWEDMCGSGGPLIDPDIFKQYVVPGYMKIRNKLDEYGIKFLAVDCDGLIEPLIRLWLDAGVNIMYPIEIGKWNANPHQLRKKFGKELRMIGGYNKHMIEKGKSEIDKELEKRLPLMKEGGFILMPDHLITPDTPLENYKYYLEQVRRLKF